jgi:energy-coupling factor transport system permease protein
MIGSSPALGQYFPVDSALHRLDPRFKLIMILAFIISLFFIEQAVVMVGALSVVPLLLLFSKLPVRWLWRSLRPLVFILFFTMSIHIFLTPGEPLWVFGPLRPTGAGLARGAFFSLRLVMVITVSSFITLTTSPVALTDALEALLGPTKRLGVPVHELALMTTIALRFIPTLLDEAQEIIRAQKARGADFESGFVAKRVRGLVPVLIPLFVGSFRRADDLATAMEARGYAGSQRRSRLHQLKLDAGDYLWLLGGTLVVAAMLAVDQMLS